APLQERPGGAGLRSDTHPRPGGPPRRIDPAARHRQSPRRARSHGPLLTLVTPGLRAGLGGRATFDLQDLERTRLALTMAAELDAAAFPVRLPAGVLARGKAAIDAQVSGTLGAR